MVQNYIKISNNQNKCSNFVAKSTIIMTKTLQIPYQETLAGKPLDQVNTLIDTLGAETHIDSLNWPELYPYKPNTAIRLAYTNDYLFVKWHVQGKNLKAVHTEDLQRVSADSCVEFFCQMPNDDHYFNFEFNCIGTSTASYRLGRAEDVVRLTPEEFSQILRYSSLPHEPFEEKEGDFSWTLLVAIPFSLLQRKNNQAQLPNLQTSKLPNLIKANFYKCADLTATKHYVSWNPIPTDKPDFHCPQYFGELHL